MTIYNSRGNQIDTAQIAIYNYFLQIKSSFYYTTCNIKITYQCKIIIVPEEGWFGQPKYSTHKKDPSTLCRHLLLFSFFVKGSTSVGGRGGPNPLADMDPGGPNPLADLDGGVQF